MAFNCSSTLCYIRSYNILLSKRNVVIFPFLLLCMVQSQYFHFISLNFYFYCSESYMSFACNMQSYNMLAGWKIKSSWKTFNRIQRREWYVEKHILATTASCSVHTCFWIPETCIEYCVVYPINWFLSLLMKEGHQTYG